MSDSGKTLGDCRHGRSDGRCVDCLLAELASLRARVAALEDGLRLTRRRIEGGAMLDEVHLAITSVLEGKP